MPVMAKKLTKADQLSHQSSAELKADLVTLTASLGLQRAFLDRKLSEGHVVNAIILWLTKLPEPRKSEVASHALGMLEDFVLDLEIRPAEPILPVGRPDTATEGRVDKPAAEADHQRGADVDYEKDVSPEPSVAGRVDEKKPVAKVDTPPRRASRK